MPTSSRTTSSKLPSDSHTLPTTLASIKNDLARPRHVARYAGARGHHPALAPYETVAALLLALAPSSRLTLPDRSAVVSALVTEHQRASHPFWSQVLLVAFEPMLIRLRLRVSRTRSADLDQRVLVAFLTALRGARAGAYVVLALRRATWGEIFGGNAAEESESEHLPFDEETHPADVFGIDDADKARAAEVVRIIEAHGGDAGDELRDAMLATRTGDESLRSYVARTHPGASLAERASIYQRLVRARDAAESELRVRLDPRTTAAASAA